MKISEHAEHTEKLCGLRAEDIHKWIDGYFDVQSFRHFIEYGRSRGYDPYDHRRFRHCREAIDDAVEEFSAKYSRKDIECVFYCHLKDDYDGYLPTREDFTDGRFREKYHESEEEQETILTQEELKRYFRGIRYRKEDKTKNKGLFNSFGVRIGIPSAAAAVLFIAAVFLFILPAFHNSLMSEKEEMLEEISSVAVSILDYYNVLESERVLSPEQAKQKAIDEIAKLRYGPENDNYFWITDMKPVMIMHPWRPDLIGQDLSDYRDTMNRSGKRLFVESVKLVEQDGGGFLQYMWQLDESDSRTVPKLSRVEGFAPWGWIIGTGIYVNDVEEEISRLTKRLAVIMAAISAVLIIFLVYLILQSLKIERNRRQAEAGLIEAKDRYRALVEASNEGYLLILEGRNVFTNPTFRRITGYTEEEIAMTDFLNRLFPENKINHGIKSAIKDGTNGGATAEEFEAVVKCQRGTLLDMIVRSSKIFLPEENGVVISFRSLPGRAYASSRLFPEKASREDPYKLFEQLKQSSSPAAAVRVLNNLPAAVRTLVLDDTLSSDIRAYITQVYGKGLKKIASLAEAETGPPPCEYSLLSLGSSGRGEMTLFSDQDNALVFRSNSGDKRGQDERGYFLKLSDRICGLLNQAGFPYCPGGIMAMNPSWCLSLEEWKNKYRKWFRQADSISILDIHVFFDISTGWGSEKLPDELNKFIFSEIQSNPGFLLHFARNCLDYKVPKGITGKIRTELRDGMHVINLKQTMLPLVNYARISALRDGVGTASTLGRLLELHRSGKIEDESYSEITEAFEKLWRLRFSNQVIAHGNLRKVNDDLNPSELPSKTRSELREAVSVIAALQSRLSYEFLGVDLS